MVYFWLVAHCRMARRYRCIIMSKRFKRQDYAAYKKLGIKWRKPKGHQSKQRVKKRGSGPMPRIGYRTKKEVRTIISVVRNVKDLGTIKGAARIAAGVGARTVLAIAEEAKKLKIEILNKKKIRRAEQIMKAIKPKKEIKEQNVSAAETLTESRDG